MQAEGQRRPRWQAMIEVGELIETQPEEEPGNARRFDRLQRKCELVR
jgi:hypothetical protein